MHRLTAVCNPRHAANAGSAAAASGAAASGGGAAGAAPSSEELAAAMQAAEDEGDRDAAAALEREAAAEAAEFSAEPVAAPDGGIGDDEDADAEEGRCARASAVQCVCRTVRGGQVRASAAHVC